MSAMPVVPVLETERLRLRGWREADLAPIAAINGDPAVMTYLGATLDRNSSDMVIGRFLQKWVEEPQFGWWAVEHIEDRALIGLVGLGRPDFELPCSPCVEIGWRLARDYWGQGLATEAARACLKRGFAVLRLPEIVSFTVAGNARSRAVMDRLGFREEVGQDFDHPMVPEGNPLRRHVLYRMRREDWQARQAD